MARNLSGLTVSQPSTDPDITEAGTFTFEVSMSFAGGGGVNSYDLAFQYDQGTGSWVTIPASSGGLTTADTAYIASSTSLGPLSITVTGVTEDVYSIRALNTSRTLTSGTQAVTVTAVDTEDNLTADNLQSASQLSTPDIAQVHKPTADDLRSASQLSQPELQQTVDCLADDLQSSSQLSTPAIEETNVLTADDLQSASQLSTPAIAQDQTLLADNLQSAAQLSTPAVAQENTLLADDLQSTSQLSEPTVEAVASVADLTADDLQGASQLSTPAIAQDQTLLADDLQSASQLSTPAIAEVSILTADNLQSAAQLSTPAITQVHDLLADDLQSAAQLSTPALAETIQYLVPDADTTVGNWTTHTGSTSNLYQQIDEQVANDNDYIQSEAAPSASVVKFALANGSPTPTADDTQRVRYRYGKDADDGVAMDLTVSLIEGASTVRATWTHLNIPATLATVNQVLTTPQKAAITDYDNLFIQFEASI